MLKANALCMQYDDTMAIKNLSFSVAPGEIFCLLGQNGAGKTTTINIFLGILKPTSGEAFINDTPVTDKTIQNSIAYIPEIVQLYGNLSGIENLDFFSRLAGYTYSKEELVGFLQKANLQESAYTKRLSNYSKGNASKSRNCYCTSKKCIVHSYGRTYIGFRSQSLCRICRNM